MAVAVQMLHFTGNDEADTLLAADPFALLVGFALDQQVPVPTAFTGPLKLKQRLGTLEPGRIAKTDPAKLEAAFREKPAIHRFPGTMAQRVQDLAAHVVDEYGGDAERVWGDAAYRDPRTIDVHIRHLREKLEIEAKHPELILTVRGVGYRFCD